MSDSEYQKIIDALSRHMDAAIGDGLYEQAAIEVLAFGEILPVTQLEIQHRMANAVGLDHPIHPEELPPK